MAPENIAVVVTVSVLGGVIVIALVVVCVAKVMSDKKLKKTIAREQEHGGYGDMMALEETHEHPSYVHYPEPEPYTPTHPPETDPWRMSNPEPTHDTHDHGRPGHDPSRHPSLHKPYIGPPNGAPNIQRRASDVPRRGPYVGGVQRRVSRAEILGRLKSRSSMHVTRAPSAVSQVQKLPTRRGSLQPSSEPPSGESKKLWYFYLNEEPGHFSRAMERNMEQAREKVEKEMLKEEKERSRSSEQSRVRRKESVPIPHRHSQPVRRQQSFQHAQPYKYPYNPGPSTQYM